MMRVVVARDHCLPKAELEVSAAGRTAPGARWRCCLVRGSPVVDGALVTRPTQRSLNCAVLSTLGAGKGAMDGRRYRCPGVCVPFSSRVLVLMVVDEDATVELLGQSVATGGSCDVAWFMRICRLFSCVFLLRQSKERGDAERNWCRKLSSLNCQDPAQSFSKENPGGGVGANDSTKLIWGKVLSGVAGAVVRTADWRWWGDLSLLSKYMEESFDMQSLADKMKVCHVANSYMGFNHFLKISRLIQDCIFL